MSASADKQQDKLQNSRESSQPNISESSESQNSQGLGQETEKGNSPEGGRGSDLPPGEPLPPTTGLGEFLKLIMSVFRLLPPEYVLLIVLTSLLLTLLGVTMVLVPFEWRGIYAIIMVAIFLTAMLFLDGSVKKKNEAGKRTGQKPITRFAYIFSTVLIIAGIGCLIWFFGINVARPLPEPKQVAFTGDTVTFVNDVAATGSDVWFATDKGLARYDNTSVKGNLHLIKNTPSLGALAFNNDGDIIYFLETDPSKTGLGWYSTRTSEVYYQPTFPIAPPLKSFAITQNGNLFVSGFDKTLAKCAPESQTVLNCQIIANPDVGLTILIDISNSSSEHNMLFGSAGAAVMSWETGQNKWRLFPELSCTSGLALDQWGNLWVSSTKSDTCPGGVYVLPAGEVRAPSDKPRLIHCTQDFTPLPSDTVLAITTSPKKDQVWMVTNRGIALIDVSASPDIPSDCWFGSKRTWRVWHVGDRHDSFWDRQMVNANLAVVVSQPQNSPNQPQTLWIVQKDFPYFSSRITPVETLEFSP